MRVAVPFGATLVSLLCFGQAVRLAVHIGFNVRVQGISVNRATDTRDGGGDAGSRHAGARLPQGEAPHLQTEGSTAADSWNSNRAGRLELRQLPPHLLSLPAALTLLVLACGPMGADESLLLGQEVVVMLQRCELYFTLVSCVAAPPAQPAPGEAPSALPARHHHRVNVCAGPALPVPLHRHHLLGEDDAWRQQ